ncbi:MAG: hypothetical protein QXT54_00210 [Thermoplasmatales archaeon]
MRLYYEFPLNEQPQDAYEKLVESLDDVNVWRGHVKISKIDSNYRESVLAFRNKKQGEWVEFRRDNLSIVIRYGKGPMKGYQIFQVLEDKIIIMANIKMRGISDPFTSFALSHILEGEIAALKRLFPPLIEQENIK